MFLFSFSSQAENPTANHASPNYQFYPLARYLLLLTTIPSTEFVLIFFSTHISLLSLLKADVFTRILVESATFAIAFELSY